MNVWLNRQSDETQHKLHTKLWYHTKHMELLVRDGHIMDLVDALDIYIWLSLLVFKGEEINTMFYTNSYEPFIPDWSKNHTNTWLDFSVKRETFHAFSHSMIRLWTSMEQYTLPTSTTSSIDPFCFLSQKKSDYTLIMIRSCSESPTSLECPHIHMPSHHAVASVTLQISQTLI